MMRELNQQKGGRLGKAMNNGRGGFCSGKKFILYGGQSWEWDSPRILRRKDIVQHPSHLPAERAFGIHSFSWQNYKKDRSPLVLSDDYYYSGESTIYLYQRVFNEWSSRSGDFFFGEIYTREGETSSYTLPVIQYSWTGQTHIHEQIHKHAIIHSWTGMETRNKSRV